ncbi:hypothetical protein AGDE_14410 [Angomonas deanei]|uniref:Uncharacterized protein n=1 Tax=Angomonas deanei TaxID=59799 RepID=A0A7G2CQK1_9TRYP|nr:hypothetical protein AGDE_14410 [Angomonas deanei]CAD2222116.1 hypothetical protein, conserved [Angomonas deanei]|eukprot:EPY20915.1 hypothetical protein AGDE_14410 [Angomonas deanei]
MRMIRLVDLYEPLIKEACPISQTSLRRIVVLGTRGTRGSLKKWVIREIGIVKDEYVNWIGQAILFYMCKDRVFQSLLAPLQIQTSRPSPRFTLFQYEPSSREAMKKYFHDSRKSISNSLLWNKGTRAYFLSLKTLWDTRFKDIVLFDVHASQWETKAVDFVEQLKSSLHAALTRIRIEFYSNVEDFFFTYIPDARNILTLTESEVKNSVFQKIFVATRVFFVNELRSLVFSDLENLLSVFQRGELRGSRITRTVAKKSQFIPFQ